MSKPTSYQAFDFVPPSIDDIERIGQEVLAKLPETFTQHLTGVVMRVEEFPDADTEKAMALESPYDLLGLYHGVPVGHDYAFATPEQPDMIFLYRKPLLAYWCDHDFSLSAIIENTLIHEIGHHFGLSDEDMHNIEFATNDALDR